ncbi:hypothetical protein E2C01_022600 [Portunus trituberculatus]|uniref:Uncharacterized protein n=1 Tax=Portunus trituberculatus TaxID=210409 RepID=A0A5B7E5T7_PORTR|nr:hypothetical protein [Portunus trituberculatus]
MRCDLSGVASLGAPLHPHESLQVGTLLPPSAPRKSVARCPRELHQTGIPAESRSPPGAVQVRDSVWGSRGVATRSRTSLGGKLSWAGTLTTYTRQARTNYHPIRLPPLAGKPRWACRCEDQKALCFHNIASSSLDKPLVSVTEGSLVRLESVRVVGAMWRLCEGLSGLMEVANNAFCTCSPIPAARDV